MTKVVNMRISLWVMLAAVFALPSMAQADDQAVFDQAANQFGLRRATAEDEAQSSGSIARVRAHNKSGEKKTGAEFRLNPEDQGSTHTDGNACVQPTGDANSPDFFFATGPALNTPDFNDPIIVEGGIPSPGSTGPMTFGNAPVNGGTVPGNLWGNSNNRSRPNPWGSASVDSNPDTFLDGPNCAAGCNPSGISTIGQPLGGSPWGPEFDASGTGIGRGGGIILIDDNLVNGAINDGNLIRAAELLRDFQFGGQPVIPEPNASPNN